MIQWKQRKTRRDAITCMYCYSFIPLSSQRCFFFFCRSVLYSSLHDDFLPSLPHTKFSIHSSYINSSFRSIILRLFLLSLISFPSSSLMRVSCFYVYCHFTNALSLPPCLPPFSSPLSNMGLKIGSERERTHWTKLYQTRVQQTGQEKHLG